jgi:hypothetical protein
MQLSVITLDIKNIKNNMGFTYPFQEENTAFSNRQYSYSFRLPVTANKIVIVEFIPFPGR